MVDRETRKIQKVVDDIWRPHASLPKLAGRSWQQNQSAQIFMFVPCWLRIRDKPLTHFGKCFRHKHMPTRSETVAIFNGSSQAWRLNWRTKHTKRYFFTFFEHLRTVDDDVPFSNYIELVLSTVVAAWYRHALAASVPLRTPLISLWSSMWPSKTCSCNCDETNCPSRVSLKSTARVRMYWRHSRKAGCLLGLLFHTGFLVPNVSVSFYPAHCAPTPFSQPRTQ